MLCTPHNGRRPKRNNVNEEQIMQTQHHFRELVKEMLPCCIEIITYIVNILLKKDYLLMIGRHQLYAPCIKKPGLDLIKKNYRPMSNLCLLSKLVKCCMLKQLISYCNTNSSIADFQSDYRENYSTETSLMKKCNDILWSMEKQQITMVVILYLSATFDTVDHNILLKILQNHYGIKDNALQ